MLQLRGVPGLTREMLADSFVQFDRYVGDYVDGARRGYAHRRVLQDRYADRLPELTDRN